MNCSNCENPIKDPKMALLVTRGPDGDLLAAICAHCQHEVKTAKIVLGRSNVISDFMYEGYLPVATAK